MTDQTPPEGSEPPGTIGPHAMDEAKEAATNRPAGAQASAPPLPGGFPPTPPRPPAGAASRSRRRLPRPVLIGLGATLALVAIVGGLRYYAYATSHVSTDDAFIDGNIVQVSPQVAGPVAEVHVTDNQPVRRGDLLVVIDPRNYEARLAQARAALAAAVAGHQGSRLNVGLTQGTSTAGVDQARSALEAAQAQVIAARSRLAQAQAQVDMARANAEQARAQVVAAQADVTRTAGDAKRYEELYREAGVSRQQRDYAVTAADAAAAQLDAARKRVVAAEAQVADSRAAAHAAADGLHQAEAQAHEAAAALAAAQAEGQQVAIRRSDVAQARAQVAQAEAAVRQAELDLSYTRILAPVSGHVTEKAVAVGDYVVPGQELMAIVPNTLYVTANFKETDLAVIRPGQPVDIQVDAYPGLVFKGHVDSIQRGSGARFSLLPPENATGNYVKVVQRVPVKIVFDRPPDPSHPLGPGMSVVPVVRTR
jgi:membrane fusion protein (multidrug efflux system)